ncbi:MAG: DUF2974 domain-containing protein [Clostridia bacterium]|nr:DUF2974 domain-containing protein [Clostridia bacterium]
MANVFDYLTWRADVPLSVDPFNDVDNLVLAQLSYTDFSGIVPGDWTRISLSDAARAFYSLHSREEIQADKSFTAKAPFLMDEMIQGARFEGTLLSRYVNEIDPEKGIQLSALTYDLPDGTRYIAFRGTDGTVVGWKEDFNFSYLPETEGQSRAVQYLNTSGADFRVPLRVGGHSKGGNLAMYAASFCEPEVQERILAVYSNDGPGFRMQVVKSREYEQILPRIRSIIPDSSMIGMLLNNRAQPLVVKSSAAGMVQHDAFTWQIRRNRFEETVLSDMSQVVSRTLSDWLCQVSDEERANLINTIFSLFESTGKDSFREIGEQGWKGVETMMNHFRSLPKEKQQEAFRLLTMLGMSSGMAAMDYLRNMAMGRREEQKAETGGGTVPFQIGTAEKGKG